MRGAVVLTMLAAAVAGFAQERNVAPAPAPGNVTLPLYEYNRLLDLAAKPAKPPQTPPAAYTMGSADIRLEAGSTSAAGTILLEGQVLAKGDVKIPLVAGMIVLDGAERGTPLPLEAEGANHVTVLNGPAEFAVTLKAGLPVHIEAGRASVRFSAPAAGTVRLVLAVPGDNTDLHVLPGLITGLTSGNGRTTVEATLVPGQETTVSWATRETIAPAAPREVRFLSDIKTLISVGEAGLTAAALASVTVVQGEPAEFTLELPSGYEVTGVTGPELVSSDIQAGVLILRERSGTPRAHQFLVSMERTVEAGKTEVPLSGFRGAQRETGEVLVEAEGAIELGAKEGGGLQRMDLKETSPYLVSLAHAALQAAFRYHRQPGEPPRLALEWVRFPDSSVIRSVAKRAVVTTMVTSEGRSLTEVKLTVKNQAQPFLKLGLPKGATVVSADVAGEKVKPVEGPDGNRVPLLRAGFQPSGAYEVSFVYVDSGTPFAKKGGSEIVLPQMDVPIGLLQWEVFLPERYKVTDFGGDAIAERLMPMAGEGSVLAAPGLPPPPAAPSSAPSRLQTIFPSQVGGVAVDPSGVGVAGTHVTVAHLESGLTLRADTDSEGQWVVSGVPSGHLKITANAPGFHVFVLNNVPYDAGRGGRYRLDLTIGGVAETVTVSAEAASLPMQTRRAPVFQETKASANVMNLQKRVAGVLPVAVEVPRAGTSFRFVRPLVVDEETKVTFSYKTK